MRDDLYHGIPLTDVGDDGRKFCGGCGSQIGASWWCCYPCFFAKNPDQPNINRACSFCNAGDSLVDRDDHRRGTDTGVDRFAGVDTMTEKDGTVLCDCGAILNDYNDICNLCYYKEFPEDDIPEQNWVCCLCTDPLPLDRRTNYCVNCDERLHPVTEAEVSTAIQDLQQWIK